VISIYCCGAIFVDGVAAPVTLSVAATVSAGAGADAAIAAGADPDAALSLFFSSIASRVCSLTSLKV